MKNIGKIMFYIGLELLENNKRVFSKIMLMIDVSESIIIIIRHILYRMLKIKELILQIMQLPLLWLLKKITLYQCFSTFTIDLQRI
jgi:hypothetical protein